MHISQSSAIPTSRSCEDSRAIRKNMTLTPFNSTTNVSAALYLSICITRLIVDLDKFDFHKVYINMLIGLKSYIAFLKRNTVVYSTYCNVRTCTFYLRRSLNRCCWSCFGRCRTVNINRKSINQQYSLCISQSVLHYNTTRNSLLQNSVTWP